VPNTGALFVAVPDLPDIEEAHVTLCYFGELATLREELVEDLREAVQDVAGAFEPFDAQVVGTAVLGPDKAAVLLIESAPLVAIRNSLLTYESVTEALDNAERQFPWWIPHCTTGYGQDPMKDPPESIRITSLGFWQAEDKDDLPLTGEVSIASAAVPTISSAQDLPLGINYGSQVPSSRWYVMKRAAALGMSDRIPAQWSR
jgi:hypothetical protein